MARRRSLATSDFGDDQFVDLSPDPMAGITNLVDAMLVFACGLMLAIVTYWNIDLPNVQQVLMQKEMTEIEDIEVTEDQMNASGSLYNEKGMVYEDPQTGKLYLLTEDEE